VTDAVQGNVGDAAGRRIGPVAKGWVALGLVKFEARSTAGYAGIRVARFLLSPFHERLRPPIGRIDRSSMSSMFDSSCRRCPRLASFLDSVKHQNPEYYCKPVPPLAILMPGC